MCRSRKPSLTLTTNIMKAILGKKIGMAQIFKSEKVVPVPLVKADPCKVTQLKPMEKEGYEEVQM